MHGVKKEKKFQFQILRKAKICSVITALTPSKVLRCQRINGCVKQHDFLCFVINLLDFYNLEKCPKKVIIFLDNARFHHSKFVQDSLLGKVTFLFNAGYSPMLNPIEEFFAKFKRLIKKKSTKNEVEIIHAVENSMREFQKSDFRGFLRHTLRYAEDSISNMDL